MGENIQIDKFLVTTLLITISLNSVFDVHPRIVVFRVAIMAWLW